MQRYSCEDIHDARFKLDFFGNMWYNIRRNISGSAV